MPSRVDPAVLSALKAIASNGEGQLELTDSFLRKHSVTAIAAAFAGEYVEVGRIFEDNSQIDWKIFVAFVNGRVQLDVNAFANSLFEFLKPTLQREFLRHNRIYLRLSGLGKMALETLDQMATKGGSNNEADARRVEDKQTFVVPPKSKLHRGRPVKSKPSKVDLVVKAMIDCGDVEQYGRRWKELAVRYTDKLPNRMSADALRKRIEAEERRRGAENK
ncbi:MAG: hypothetical protein AAB385_05620 [Planctomycetota bacterium]